MLVGNRRGIDHFPLPVISREKIEALRDEFDPAINLDDSYPINVDFQTMMILSWRVKQLQLTAMATNAEYDFIIHSVAGGDSSHTTNSKITLDGSPDVFGFSDDADERSLVTNLHFDLELDRATTLVTPGYQTLQRPASISDLTTDGDEEIDPITDPSFLPVFDVQFLASTNVTSHIIYDDSVDPSKPFWPCLVLTCNFAGGLFDYSFASKRDATDGTATIVLGETGKTIDIPLAYSSVSHNDDDPGVVTYETTVDSGTATFEIDAVKFFPFKDSNGEAVFDEDTGVKN